MHICRWKLDSKPILQHYWLFPDDFIASIISICISEIKILPIYRAIRFREILLWKKNLEI